MDVKSFHTRIEIKDAAKGIFTAMISTLNVKDSDGDVTLPGAFADGAELVISAYGHASWGGWSAAMLPVGDGVLRTSDTQTFVDGRMYLDTTAGKDTFTTIKNLAEKNLGEWSYGYDILKASFGDWQGDQVRFLESLKVFEASPVLVGAGVDTRTVVAKALKSAGLADDQVAAILAAVKGVPSQTLADQLGSSVDALGVAIDSAARVGALRAEVGKPLSTINQDLLKRAQDELGRLKDLVGVDAPTVDSDGTQREYLLFLRSLQRSHR